MKSLIPLDLQNDFLPGGALHVPLGDTAIPVANCLMPENKFVVVRQDWHPADSQSFASQHESHALDEVITVDGREQILRQDRCIRGTLGAESADLETEGVDRRMKRTAQPIATASLGQRPSERDKLGCQTQGSICHRLRPRGLIARFQDACLQRWRVK